MHENRETSSVPAEKAGRSAKAQSQTADVYALEESDRCVLPMKQPNKEGQPSAEAVEGRRRPKENDAQPNTQPTQSGERVSQGLNGVRQVARERKQERFTALLHHVTVPLLRESFQALKKNAAPGVDGVTWREYETGLEDRLIDLHGRVHCGAYRAQPSRRVYIPKADGRQRPLGIAALEDKIVQQAVVTVLNEIFETDFQGFSYGFRPGRDPHQALDALNAGLQKKRVNWVLDADIKGFFDHVSHEWLLKFVEHRVADTRVLRLIQKWLKAGVSEDGTWSETDVGTPQGAVVSPLLANVYLHYVFDLWVEAWRRKVASGHVVVVRYADDLVVGFQHRAEAERFLKELQERLAKFGLEIQTEKTRLIEFGRFAASDRRKRNEGKPETFTFLGFTHFCGANSKGHFVVWRHTAAKRMRAKLHAIKQELRRMMHEPVAQVGAWLKRVVSGYYRYHAVPGNLSVLSRFRERVCGYWRHVLRRRSQRRKPDWDRLRPIFERWIPRPRTLHPYPDKRFDARIQGRSRMR
ncbi:MAG: group II intron reverse transcriptase/maturase [Acidobacteriota bacterium]|nr:group II intron reverse transcriptase/maturase [Acidobacteriota bacterium]